MSALQAFAVLMIRFWAIGWIIGYFTIFSQSLAMSGQAEPAGQLFVIAGQIAYLLILIFWILVLAYARRVSLWVLPPVKELDQKFQFEPADIIRIGTFLIGIYFLTEYVPEFLQSAPHLVVQYENESLSRNPGLLIEPAGSLIGIFIALWLTIRPGNVERLFSWLRRAGQGAVTPEARQMPKAE